MKFVNIFMKTRWAGLIIIFLLFCLLIGLPFPWNESLENFFIDLRFQLRGKRQVTDQIIFVFIGAEDIQALGGRRITRDYFGYMTHILSQAGAKIIAFDILFDTHTALYTEYDDDMANLFEFAGNVCLPMAFHELVPVDSTTTQSRIKPPVGHDPVLPIQKFVRYSRGIGFSNLGRESIVRRVPIVARSADSLLFAFGCEMARHYLNDLNAHIKLNSNGLELYDENGDLFSIPLNEQGELCLNHFGGHENIRTMSFVDVLQTYSTKSDSLDFQGKLLVVAITAPGFPTLKATPLAAALPASLIQVTVAENIISQNYLLETSTWWTLIILALLVTGVGLFLQSHRQPLLVLGSLSLVGAYWLISILVFNHFYRILPLAYPTLAFIAAFVFALLHLTRVREQENVSQNILLKQQVAARQTQLETAQNQLTELQQQLLKESQEKAALSAESQQKLEAQKQTVLRLEKELRDLQTYSVESTTRPQPQFDQIIYSEQSSLIPVLELIQKMGSDDIPVLIIGETGTGKEMIARAIHQHSQRRNAPFVAINCGALPETLLESELFGHEKGSFTGAHSRRRGRFELADGGTLFLDEITETTPLFQAKLLRVLQEGTFERVGSEQTLKVSVRIIAASNSNPDELVEKGQFRADLFYRLNGFPLALPPLRERQSDIPVLADFFLKKHSYRTVAGFSENAMHHLLNYHWPGNVRELENAVRRAAILASSEKRALIQIRDLPEPITLATPAESLRFIHQPLENQILEMLRTLKFSHSAIRKTAEALGNRDRGTITEYFRGLCFEYLVNADFDRQQAAQKLAGTSDGPVIERVESKMSGYLENLRPTVAHLKPDDSIQEKFQSQIKGLPKKYHPFLEQVIEYLRAEMK